MYAFWHLELEQLWSALLFCFHGCLNDTTVYFRANSVRGSASIQLLSMPSYCWRDNCNRLCELKVVVGVVLAPVYSPYESEGRIGLVIFNYQWMRLMVVRMQTGDLLLFFFIFLVFVIAFLASTKYLNV